MNHVAKTPNFEKSGISNFMRSFNRKNKQIARGGDIGYGFLKYTREIEGSIQPGVVPAIVAARNVSEIHDEGSIMQKRDTVTVKAGKNYYEVGPDVELSQVVAGARNLSEDYIYSEEYLAKYHAVLHYIGETDIDLLVTGLPLNHVRNNKKVEHVKQLFVGRHEIYDGQVVNVKKVAVTAQPCGGLTNHAIKTSSMSQISKERNLVVDPGQRTFDFLMTEGLKPIYHMSDSHNTSMQKVIDAIRRNVSDYLGTHYNSYSDIEKALQTGKIKLNKTIRPIDDFIDQSVRSIANEAVQIMYSQLDEIYKIDNVFLVGGGAKFFESALQDAFPKLKIQTSESPIYDNVIGYHLMGCMSLMQN